MRTSRLALGILALTALLFAPAAPVLAEEVIVSAAASLTNAFDAVKKGFEAAHPGFTVACNYAASGALLRQMESGAPADVFASADQKTMDEAAAKGLIIPASRRDFARNGLVLVVPADSSLGLRDLADLARAGVERISLGNPEIVPAGRYAKESLAAVGLWEALKTKYIYGNNVRQVLDYVARGEVDAAFIFATDARTAGAKVRVVCEAATRTPALYPVALVAPCKKPAAKVFADYLLSAEAQRILGAFGFKKP
ncbi:MAG: molybdate ABC transporter substrate-binding protein [Proteobacteria bacterium]|nr:molybdate ABC transporter substrate-binding protein [Pseudomonadota bacterium]MBU1594151.1 molybdate ABC transporter substrate-binding protein [Pseudomonadota bacterium]